MRGDPDDEYQSDEGAHDREGEAAIPAPHLQKPQRTEQDQGAVEDEPFSWAPKQPGPVERRSQGWAQSLVRAEVEKASMTSCVEPADARCTNQERQPQQAERSQPVALVESPERIPEQNSEGENGEDHHRLRGRCERAQHSCQ